MPITPPPGEASRPAPGTPLDASRPAGSLRLAAVDLGATSGRVMVGTVTPAPAGRAGGGLELVEVHRFGNGPVEAADGSLHWDVARLWREVRRGLALAGDVDGLGVDSWAVDYGLLDADGALLGDPYSYRDSRTDGVAERVLRRVPARELYAVTGMQQLPFNTLYQLVAERSLASATTMLMLPDLFGYWLTGSVGAEATNASTTQLYDVRARAWATGLAERVDVPAALLPPLREPGDLVGTLTPEAAAQTGLVAGTPVVAVGSHDTASAVVGVPFDDPRRAAYISSGTWSLVGVELDAPVLDERARLANFTNEGGVDATTRFLRNVTGLWLLTESLRTWGAADQLGALLACRGLRPAGRSGRRRRGPGLPHPGRRAGSHRAGLPGPAARPRRPTGRRPCAASWTAWPWPTGATCGWRRR